MGQLNSLDWIVVALYFIAVFGVAIGAAVRAKLTRQTSAGYFLAGRNVGWFVIGASLFASNIGSEHLVGLAGAGAGDQFVFGQYEVQASLILLLLGWVFVPFYIRSTVYTMPEFLERRFSPAARWYLAIISIVGYILTKISVTIAAGGIVFESLMGINFWTGAVIVVIVTGIYTIFGGLRAVLYTDLLQTFVLIGGAVAVTLVGLHQLGGWGEMVNIVGEDYISLWRPFSDPDFPWTGILFGAPIVGIWYWCTDQFIVQRTLSARNITQARGGTILAGFLKQLPLFLFVLPGVIAYALQKTGALELASPDEALPTLVVQLLPTGFRGLVAAGLLAALMSSLSSVFNSCSTLVTIDIYKKLRPLASERRLVIVGQISTACMVVAGLAWIPFMADISDKLYHYLQSVQSYISPPIAAVFLFGVFWWRANGPGAIVSMLVGFALGALRLVLELNADQLTEGTFWHSYAAMNFMHMSILLFVTCSAVLVIVSLASAPEPKEKLAGLTYATTQPELAAADPNARRWRPTLLALTTLLLATVAAIWWYFS